MWSRSIFSVWALKYGVMSLGMIDTELHCAVLKLDQTEQQRLFYIGYHGMIAKLCVECEVTKSAY